MSISDNMSVLHIGQGTRKYIVMVLFLPVWESVFFFFSYEFLFYMFKDYASTYFSFGGTNIFISKLQIL